MEIKLPPVIFGTSGLGNLFVALDEEAKMKIMEACIRLRSTGTGATGRA